MVLEKELIQMSREIHLNKLSNKIREKEFIEQQKNHSP